ncbi:nonstructural polyprotein [Anopheles sinensis]|uniref:Nonstructural polyprotein n=1 Tax=Anopheles sinensis TaxID=74873 RepID=A0A084VVQ3_ANOSI|nr:nonstructural polyprotein [Anopheles sinensis]
MAGTFQTPVEENFSVQRPYLTVPYLDDKLFSAHRHLVPVVAVRLRLPSVVAISTGSISSPTNKPTGTGCTQLWELHHVFPGRVGRARF